MGPKISKAATLSSPLSAPRPRELLPPPTVVVSSPLSASLRRTQRSRRSCTSLDTTTRCAGCADLEGGSSPRRSSTSTASSWRLKTRRGPPRRRHLRDPGRRARCARVFGVGSGWVGGWGVGGGFRVEVVFVAGFCVCSLMWACYVLCWLPVCSQQARLFIFGLLAAPPPRDEKKSVLFLSIFSCHVPSPLGRSFSHARLFSCFSPFPR